MSMLLGGFSFFFVFFNDTATTEIYTLSLHDALPIYLAGVGARAQCVDGGGVQAGRQIVALAKARIAAEDRKSTRLNSSHGYTSYAVFCLQKKKNMARSSWLWLVHRRYSASLSCSCTA